jgi:hypothetical protein
VHGKLPGSRLSWILVDDILSDSNTSTAEQRETVTKWFFNSVLSRKDVRKSKIVVTNTPWHPEDLTYKLEAQGWPTITMDAWGNITFSNADDFDCDDIRPSEFDETGKAHRLTAHDLPCYAPEFQHVPAGERDALAPDGWTDTTDDVYLWPEKFGRETMEALREEYSERTHVFNQIFSMKTHDEASSRFKTAWIARAKENARKAGIYTFKQEWREGRTFTGVDIATGKGRKNDRSSVFTLGVLPDKTRLLLRLESGRWSSKELIGKIIEHHDSFGSIIRVETNAAQDILRQWLLDEDKSLPVRGSHTGANKHSREHGIESIFLEFENGSWMVPCDPTGRVDPAVQRWLDGMLYYNPDKHTADELISCWLARSEASERGHLKRPRGAAGNARTAAAIAGVSAR